MFALLDEAQNLAPDDAAEAGNIAGNPDTARPDGGPFDVIAGGAGVKNVGGHQAASCSSLVPVRARNAALTFGAFVLFNNCGTFPS